MTRRRLLEVCVETLDGIDAAVRGGADRIELCAALDLGGITPPRSLIERAAAAPLPVHLLVRPRTGDFVYSAAEQDMVAADIRLASEAGLAGVVIGASRADRRLDTAVLARWIALAQGLSLSVTLHRAFDLVPDHDAALDEAIALGVDRILTAGGAVRVAEGMAVLLALHRRAQGRVTILAGSGINADIATVLLDAGLTELHASCRTTRTLDDALPERRFGFVGSTGGTTDAGKVGALATLIHAEG